MVNKFDDSYFELLIDTDVKEELSKTGITKDFLEKFLEYIGRDIHDDIKYFNDNYSFLDEVKIEKTKIHISKYNKHYELGQSFVIKDLTSLSKLESNILIEVCVFIAMFKNYITNIKNYIKNLKK